MSTQSCLILCDPVDYSLPGSSVLGILQARILSWVAIPFARETFPTQGLNLGLLHCRQILYHLSHREAPRKPILRDIKKFQKGHMANNEDRIPIQVQTPTPRFFNIMLYNQVSKPVKAAALSPPSHHKYWMGHPLAWC